MPGGGGNASRSKKKDTVRANIYKNVMNVIFSNISYFTYDDVCFYLNQNAKKKLSLEYIF